MSETYKATLFSKDDAGTALEMTIRSESWDRAADFADELADKLGLRFNYDLENLDE